MHLKPLLWCSNSLEQVRELSKSVRSEVGHQLNRVQTGLEPEDWKPMTSVGTGVREIRIHVTGEHRVLYVARFVEAIYVLHVFEKKNQKTAQRDIDLAARRFSALVDERRRHKR